MVTSQLANQLIAFPPLGLVRCHHLLCCSCTENHKFVQIWSCDDSFRKTPVAVSVFVHLPFLPFSLTLSLSLFFCSLWTLPNFSTSLSAMAGPRPVVLSGPSGAGKSTLLKKLMKEYDSVFGFSVSRECQRGNKGCYWLAQSNLYMWTCKFMSNVTEENKPVCVCGGLK